MESSNQSDNSTKIVLLVVGGVTLCLLILVAGCGGIAYFTMIRVARVAENAAQVVAEQADKMADALQAEAAAQAFLMDVSTGQTDRAYGMTTQGYQTRRTLKDFTAYVDQHPGLKNQNFPQPAAPTPPAVNDRVTVRLSLNGGVGAANPANVATIDMLRENGQWKVDEFLAP